jgi:predicted O-methyltransferase YrrM
MNRSQFDQLFNSIGSTNLIQRSEELWILVQAIQSISAKRILEIGTANGGTLKFFEQVAGPGGRIVTVDSGRDSIEELPVDFSAPLCDIQVVTGFSQASETIEKVIQALGNEPIDFLFIDGGHEYEAVKADFDNYHGLVRSGGIIGFHDVNYDKEGNDHVWKLWHEIDLLNKEYHNHGLGMGIIRVE